MAPTPSIASTTATAVADDQVSVLSRGSTLRGDGQKSKWSSKLTLVGGTSSKDAKDVYEETGSDREVPTTFTFGRNQVAPLVALSQLQDHLRLLAAFHSLRQECYACEKGDDKEQAWSTYLNRANHRFSIYLDKVLTWENIGMKPDRRSTGEMLDLDKKKAEESVMEFTDVREELLPPLDVAMMWHAYRLNPGRLLEDAARMPSRRILSRVNFPLEGLSRRLNLSSMQIQSKPAETFWTEATSTPFQLATQTTLGDEKGEGLVIECPVCCTDPSGPRRHLVSWQTLAHPNWRFTCERCGSRVNNEVMRGQQFYQDLTTWLQDAGEGPNCFRMRGGLLSARNGKYFPEDPHAPVLCRLYDYKRGVSSEEEGMSGLVRFPPMEEAADKKTKSPGKPFERCIPLQHFEEARGRIGELAEIINMNVVSRESIKNEMAAIDLRRRVSLLFTFYMDGDPFSPSSVDLVEAVKRQFSFVDEMHGMGWSSVDRIQDEFDVGSLAQSIVRYHKWLNVLLQHKDMLCPTLDIDLAWHTHQLFCSYQLDCFRVLDFFVDHDDKIEVTTLGGAFDKTGRLWYDMYKQPYSICGCAVHAGSTNIGKVALGSVLNKLKGKKSEKVAEDQEPVRDQATHPSNHNMVVADTYNIGRFTNERRRQMEAEDVQKGRRDEGHADVFM